jgi:hypothetical protein
MLRFSRMALLLAALLASPGAALADTAVGMRGAAPLVCSAGIDPTIEPSTGGPLDLGKLTEFCNAPQGFEVWIDYPAELAGGVLRVDGHAIVLQSAGTVRVDRADGPTGQSHVLTLDHAQPGHALSLTVRMLPAGSSSLTSASN